MSEIHEVDTADDPTITLGDWSTRVYLHSFWNKVAKINTSTVELEQVSFVSST